MAAATLDIVIEQGVLFTMTVSTNLSLTGSDVKAQIRATKGAVKIIKDFNISISGSQITLSLSSVETSRIKASGFHIDMTSLSIHLMVITSRY